MIKWNKYSAEHGFDVQLCFVLAVFGHIALEVGNPEIISGSSWSGYNSLSLRSRDFGYNFWDIAQPICLLIGAFPPTRIMTHALRKVFDERIDKACAKLAARMPIKEFREYRLGFIRSMVAIVRYLDTGSYEGLKLRADHYFVTTGDWIDDPPSYEDYTTGKSCSMANECIIM